MRDMAAGEPLAFFPEVCYHKSCVSVRLSLFSRGDSRGNPRKALNSFQEPRKGLWFFMEMALFLICSGKTGVGLSLRPRLSTHTTKN